MSEFNRADQILASLGLTEVKRFTIYKIMSAILHLGNIDFEETDFGVQVNVSTKDHIVIASQLLNVSSDDLERAILFRSIEVPGSVIMYAFLLLSSRTFTFILNYREICYF